MHLKHARQHYDGAWLRYSVVDEAGEAECTGQVGGTCWTGDDPADGWEGASTCSRRRQGNSEGSDDWLLAKSLLDRPAHEPDFSVWTISSCRKDWRSEWMPGRSATMITGRGMALFNTGLGMACGERNRYP